MKSVLISIQPKWCELIASGKKTIEVRKTRPKLETPFKCYIYETKPKRFIKGYADDDLFRHVDGRVERGFSFQLATEKGAKPTNNILSGKVFGEFVCDRLDKIEPCFEYYSDGYDIDDDMLTEVGLTREDLVNYGKGNPVYGWHISDLKIYDTPKELGEFEKPCICKDTYEGEEYCDCLMCDLAGDSDYGVIACERHLVRPPQSWCYVEE